MDDPLGLALASQERPKEAQRAWEEARNWNPRDADAVYNLAALAWRQGRRDDVAGLLRAALALKPNHPEASRLLDRWQKNG